MHGAPPHDPPVALDFGMERGFFVGRGIGVVLISQLHKNKKTWCFLFHWTPVSSEGEAQ